MKNIIIHYRGGSGGFFIYYYLLASDSNIVSKLSFRKSSSLTLGKQKNFLDACFYHQFRKNIHLNDWKKSEKWPNFRKVVSSNSRQIFLCCNEIPKNFDTSDSVIINPYIADKKKWLRMQVNKRCLHFFDIPKNIGRKEFFIHYKETYHRMAENSKVEDADYSFNFLKFLRDKDEREKLCDFLKIDINPRMEAYLTHYIDCHGKFFNKLIK